MESYEILWKTTLPELENSISSISYETYIKQLIPVDITDNKLVLITSNRLFADTVCGGKMYDIICSALSKSNSEISNFVVYVAKDRDDYIKQIGETENETVMKHGSPINPKFTFDSFVIGPSNELIYAGAKAVAEGKVDKGIVICTTGIGISIAANKVKGIRCGLCTSIEAAHMTKQHNNANMIALGGRTTDPELAYKIVDEWLDTEFEGGKHQRRVTMLDEM